MQNTETWRRAISGRPKGKNIIICCDGTGNEYGRNLTNVVRLYDAVIRDERQMALYDPGVGTFSALGLPGTEWLGLALGKAFGVGLRHNLADAYRYLMEHYAPGDRVFLFGFSRGAFIARALAGMLHKIGLLEEDSDNLIPYAFKIYNRHGNEDVARGFKRTYSRECKPYLIGVWDTVASLGWLTGKRFFDARLNRDVTYGYHAVAIDERRRKFEAFLWDESQASPEQTIEQVWFPGVHSDVGGWYEERGLSDISLRWMLLKAEAAGMRLRPDWQRRLELRPSPRAPIHRSRVGFWRLWRPVVRQIPEGAKFHRSVYERMEAERSDYLPPLPARFEFLRTGVIRTGRTRTAAA